MISAKLQQQKCGSYTISVPSAIIKAMSLQKGSVMNWKILTAGKLELSVAQQKEEDNNKTNP